jgi:S1-C subfamily serine protease
MRRALVSLVFVWGIFVFSTVFPAQASTRLSVPEVIEISTPAVVSIRVYDERDSLIGQGTGFFVSSKGELVTNFRALRRAHRVLVKTSSGETLTVRGMIAQNQKYELIKLLVRVRVPNSWLPLADRLP